MRSSDLSSRSTLLQRPEVVEQLVVLNGRSCVEAENLITALQTTSHFYRSWAVPTNKRSSHSTDGGWRMVSEVVVCPAGGLSFGGSTPPPTLFHANAVVPHEVLSFVYISTNEPGLPAGCTQKLFIQLKTGNLLNQRSLSWSSRHPEVLTCSRCCICLMFVASCNLPVVMDVKSFWRPVPGWLWFVAGRFERGGSTYF